MVGGMERTGGRKVLLNSKRKQSNWQKTLPRLPVIKQSWSIMMFVWKKR